MARTFSSASGTGFYGVSWAGIFADVKWKEVDPNEPYRFEINTPMPQLRGVAEPAYDEVEDSFPGIREILWPFKITLVPNSSIECTPAVSDWIKECERIIANKMRQEGFDCVAASEEKDGTPS